MLRVVFSDRVERLWEALAERARAREDPFEKLVVATPSRVVERRAELAIARALGIAAAIDLTRLPIELEARVRSATGRDVLGASLCEGLVRDVLLTPERLASDALAPLLRYVHGEGGDGDGSGTRMLRERRACELAARLSRLYASYTLDRPELIRAWRQGEHAPASSTAMAIWQGALLREALAPLGDAIGTLAEGVDPLRVAAGAPLVVLGYSYFSRLEHALLGAIAERGEVLVLTPTPCAEFWEDATRRTAAEDDASESPLLAAWGTAAREHVAALDAATEYTADRLFARSDERTRLGRVQASIRARGPVRAAITSPEDRSIVLVAAPSLRREVEVAAGEIWARVHRAARTDAPLRFPDVAVWLPARDRDLYLPQIEAVFAEAQGIPWSGVDLALASRSRVVEALVRLVSLVAQGPTRAGLLDVLLHPLVLARLPSVPDPEALALAVERLGVYFGGEARELPSAYASDPRAIHLEQAIERLALGAVMLGEASGDERFFEREGERWLPEELDVDGGVAPVITLLRSLAADVASARAASLPLDAWARFFVSLAETYVVTEGSEEAEHRRALLALRALGGPSLEGGAALGCAAACDLALHALESLPAARGASDRGVLVGTLAPHRASDHRLVLVLGLGEGRFPSHDVETGLDLRSEAGPHARRAGEVTTQDRDRLALLEAVVSAREAIVLSWVARDEQTGDDIARAHALSELCAQLPDLAVSRPPLRRDVALLEAARSNDRDALVRVLAFPIAEREARARSLGDVERARWKDSPLPLAELVRDLADDDPRRPLLALEPIPPRPAPDASAVVRVSLDELRRFLDCPVQAAAQRVVGRADERDDDARVHDAEPFDLDAWTHARLVRALVLGAFGQGASVDALAAHGVAHGTFPLGAFGARARSLASEEAEEMCAQLRAARPGVSVAAPVRFGAGREHGDAAARALDPIALGPLPDGRTLELVGTTAPLLGGQEPLQLDFGGRREREREQITTLRLALRAFVDHAVLALEPGATPRARGALIVARRSSTRITLKPLRADLARRWLAALGRELAIEPQTSFMPIESVLRVAHLFTSGSPALERDLARSIELVRGPKWEGGRSRFGPVRSATKLPAPAAPARLAGQRFALFFQHLHEPAVHAPKRGKR